MNKWLNFDKFLRGYLKMIWIFWGIRIGKLLFYIFAFFSSFSKNSCKIGLVFNKFSNWTRFFFDLISFFVLFLFHTNFETNISNFALFIERMAWESRPQYKVRHNKSIAWKIKTHEKVGRVKNPYKLILLTKIPGSNIWREHWTSFENSKMTLWTEARLRWMHWCTCT